MTSMDEFEKSLKDVVEAKRLSASKMGKLTELTMKLVEHDTQIVSIYLRTHKSLPASSKVSSLYVLDAICRAARSHANKHPHSSSSSSAKGNSATLLTKIEAILDAVFQDLLLNGAPEAKEKSKKILDIWTKGNTFPPPVITRLMERIKEPDKAENNGKPSDPRAATQQNAAIPTATPTPPASSSTPALTDAQSTLLALLTQAANSAPANPSTISVQPDHSQLALLQQLSNASRPNFTTQSSGQQLAQGTLSDGPQNLAGPSRPNASGDFGRERSFNSERGRFSDEFPYSGPRGGHRGGFRGRGRGDYPRGRWDDRDRDRERYRDSAWSPNGRRRSKSRSPPRYQGGRRDMKPQSPPQRSPYGQPSVTGNSIDPRQQNSPPIPNSNLDEFGRERRLKSPSSDDSALKNESQASKPLEPETSAEVVMHTQGNHNHDNEMTRPHSVAASNTVERNAPSSVKTFASQAEPGLESFDISTFNFMLPASWEALGTLWQRTNGCPPTGDQLMQFVMTVQSGISPAQIVAQHRAWLASMNSNGFSGNGQGGWAGRQNSSDAVVIGGGDVSPPRGNQDTALTSQSQQAGGGGRMSKVGDKWVFVRDTGSVQS